MPTFDEGKSMTDVATVSAERLTAKFPRLAAAGYEMSSSGLLAPGVHKTDALTDENLLSRMEGRLANVAYMAKPIDVLETGHSDAEHIPGGSSQFKHLLKTSHLVWTAFQYIALRRAERDGRADALRAGLALMIAAEDGRVSHRDAANMLAPDLVQALECSHQNTPAIIEGPEA